MGGERIDFFVSYASVDRAWAEWVAWQLGEAGYTVELDVWDWAPGRNFVLGEDHPETLRSANNLEADLRELGAADDGP